MNLCFRLFVGLLCQVAAWPVLAGGIEVTAGSGDVTVKKMPLAIRNIPNHPDDNYAAYGQGPITKTDFEVPLTFSVALTVMKRDFSKDGRHQLRLKARNLLFPTYWIWHSERNYTNAVGSSERGEGAALTFLSVSEGGIIPYLGSSYVDFMLNFTPEVEYRTILGAKTAGRLAVSYTKLQAVTGWDRWNALEVRKSYTLAHCFPLTASLEIGKRLVVGGRYTFILPVGWGKQAEISSKPSLLLGWRF